MIAMMRFLTSAALVVAAASTGCASRQKPGADPTVLIAPPYDSTKRDPNAFTLQVNDSTRVVVLVEKPVTPDPSNEPPAFPPELRRTKPHGEVLAQFVVDTTGRAEMKSFKVLRSSDDLFSESVRRALPRFRFSPAEIAGRKVRQQVTMPFVFFGMSPN